MRRTTAVALTLAIVVSTVAATPVVVAQRTGTETTPATGNDTVAPGARLSGVVGVGEAELGGEVRDRAYGLRLADANTTGARAAIVADQYNATRQRVAELSARRDTLEQARENGSLPEGEYRARVATLHAQSRAVQRLANRTRETAATLPADRLEANGVTVSAIRTLQERAANLTGPETAAIAQSVAGADAGQPVRPAEVDNATNATARTPGDGASAPGPDSSAATDATTATAAGP